MFSSDTLIVGLLAISSAGFAQAPPTESVRKPASHKIAGAVGGLLGWRVGAPATAYKDATLLEAIVKADAAGLGVIEAFSTQKVSAQIAKNFDSGLTADEQATVKARFRALAMHLGAYSVGRIGPDDRKALEFAKAMGADMVVGGADIASLPAIDKLAGEVGIKVAVENKDLKALGAAVGGLSHVGIAADAAAWSKSGLKAEKLMALWMRAPGQTALLMDLVKQEPPPEEKPDACSNCGRPYGGTRPLFIAIESGKAEDVAAFEKAVRPAMGYRIDQDSKLIPITPTDKIPAAERAAIEATISKVTAAKPKKARKLLVIDLNPAGGYYHATVAHANLAIQLMARDTDAFQPIFSNDLNNLKWPKIKEYDGVFLNSVVGEVFPDPDVLNGLLRFVREGGGVAGVHGSTYASMDLPEFTDLMGAADGPHRVEPATLKVDDPASPLTKPFEGKDFERTDEFYHFLPTGPFSREKLHVLLSIDAAKSDLSFWKVRPDNDYGLAWIKSYGKGRVFNNAMGHTPTLFAEPAMAQFMMNGIQFILGDVEADTTPSAKKK